MLGVFKLMAAEKPKKILSFIPGNLRCRRTRGVGSGGDDCSSSSSSSSRSSSSSSSSRRRRRKRQGNLKVVVGWVIYYRRAIQTTHLRIALVMSGEPVKEWSCIVGGRGREERR